MSSRSSKEADRHGPDGKWGEWSFWEWDAVKTCWRRFRKHADGEGTVIYQYDQSLNTAPGLSVDYLTQERPDTSLPDNATLSQILDRFGDDYRVTTQLDNASSTYMTEDFDSSWNSGPGATNFGEQNLALQYPGQSLQGSYSNVQTPIPSWYNPAYPPLPYGHPLDRNSVFSMYGKIAELGEPAIAPAAPRLRQSLGSPSNFVSSPLQGYKPEVLTSDQSSSVNSTVDSITSNMQALNSRPRTTPYRDQDQGNSEEDYMFIANPKGYFKIGRIFKTEQTGMRDLILIVVGQKSDLAICCVANGQISGQEDFPIIVENPFVTIESPLRLNFDKTYEVEHYYKVLNIGRIDRKYLKALKERYLMERKDNTILGKAPLKHQTVQSPHESRGNALPDGAVEHHYVDQFADESGVDSLSTAEEIVAAEPNPTAPNRFVEIWSIATKNPKTKRDPLFKEYMVHNSLEFKKGRVFKVLWSEPFGGKINDDTICVDADRLCSRDGKFGEIIYSTIRRFVILKERKGHCVCLPILTYGKQGTAKPGVKANDHAIIYTGSTPPKELEYEPKLLKKPIRVIPDNSSENLRVESRINYSKVYTVEHNVKVCFSGKIHPDSESILYSDFQCTFDDEG